MTVEIQERKKVDCRTELVYVKQWPNVPTSLVPQKGDVIKVHFGDFGENVNEYIVLYRIIDGDEMGKIIVVVEERT